MFRVRRIWTDMRYQQRSYNTGWVIAYYRARGLDRARHSKLAAVTPVVQLTPLPPLPPLPVVPPVPPGVENL